jgi:hypothetical protein
MDGATATRVLEIAGADLEALCVELFSVEFLAGLGYTVGNRARHPQYNWLRAEGLSFEAGDPENPPAVAGTEYALLDATVTYRGRLVSVDLMAGQFEPEVPTGTYLSHTRTATAEMMTLPGHGFTWQNAAGDPVGEDIDAGIIIPTITHEWTWYYVLDPPWTNLRKYMGSVNRANTPYNEAKAETLLFAGYSASRDWTFEGGEFWNLSLTVIEKYIDLTPDDVGGTIYGWNHFWHPNADPPWQKLWNPAAATDEVYPLANFTNLFRGE